MKRTRIAAFLLALVLCLGLLPMTALAEEDSGKFDVIFDAHPGTFSPNGTTLMTVQTTGPKVEEPAVKPVYPGHTFDGWFTQDGKPISDVTFTEKTSVVAKWTPDTEAPGAGEEFDVIFDAHPGTFPPNGTTLMTVQTTGPKVEEPAVKPVYPGHTFDGWFTQDGKPISDVTFTEKTSVVAKWTKEGSGSEENKDGPFTVKFDLNYKNPKQDEIPKEKTVVKGDIVGLPDGSKLTAPASNYEFYAWCIEGKDGKLYPWKESNPVTEDMTLYAGWVKKGTVVKDGQAIDSKPAETQKPAEPEKPAESQKPAGTPASKFADVAATSPFAPAISWAVEKKITNGKTDTTFGPGDSCTRAQIVTFLWRAAGSPEPKLTETQYMDVTDPGAYYYKAVQWAAELDMEYSGTFDPHKTCDRASAAYFIWKAFGSPKAAAKSSFTDMPEEPKTGGQWYWPDLLDAVDWAVGQGVTNGTGDGTTFSPDNPCTRGQIVTFLYRAYEK
ncbi:S-layer homology domain-containing protein [uncultured Oscillibacter sp.]|uniref:S-layer homology domain-containing protein n=1 Tax=uncultured Oscillibacter sp. TaxID=876091 RepID=UPI00272B1717|nr:S-layer homology domain-containing protein [uncultured Oscillibacter sp.]